ncbi:hypothetical protein BB560_004698, partial [Smittium megazygosporum]
MVLINKDSSSNLNQSEVVLLEDLFIPVTSKRYISSFNSHQASPSPYNYKDLAWTLNNSDAQTVLDASEFLQELNGSQRPYQDSTATPPAEDNHISPQPFDLKQNDISRIGSNNTPISSLPEAEYPEEFSPDLNQFLNEDSPLLSTPPLDLSLSTTTSKPKDILTSVIARRSSNVYTIENLASLFHSGSEIQIANDFIASAKNAYKIIKYINLLEKNFKYQADMISARNKMSRNRILQNSQNLSPKPLPTVPPTSDPTTNNGDALDLPTKRESVQGNTLFESMLSKKSNNPFANTLLKLGLSSMALGVMKHEPENDSSNNDPLNIEKELDALNNPDKHSGRFSTSSSFSRLIGPDASNAHPSISNPNLKLAALQFLDNQNPNLNSLNVGEMRAKKLQSLEKIDSFGFLTFSDDQLKEARERNVSRYASRNSFRSVREDYNSQLSTKPSTDENSEKLLGEWDTILTTFSPKQIRKSQKMQSLAKNGFPYLRRPQIYWSLLNAYDIHYNTIKDSTFYDEYTRILTSSTENTIFEVIERDLNRSFPSHAYFYDESCNGQKKMRRILRAYANYNPNVGYCQGMNQIVGILLIVGLPEVEAFWTLVVLLETYLLDYFTPQLTQLCIHGKVFGVLLSEHNKKLANHLENAGVDPLMYVTPWFMTIFAMSLPFDSVIRIWDWFIFRGPKVLFRVALGIMDILSPELLNNCNTIDKILKLLLHIPHSTVTPDKIFNAANK